ncbi:carbohydrate ABC transporter permease [uncultured Acetatifactor sp.]|uniref:carbohydrate ABC transporter permease n=1 Tax=uncultured Acetatifactor sp. TaxID=1671927 RepID=UPI00261D5888|nr:carbohydrate ABC transporter permease [uncultured Acetatifactor sp.]
MKKVSGKRRKRLDGVQAISLLICIFAVIISLYPIYYVFIMSISNPIEAAKGVYFLPKKIFLGGYKMILGDSELWRGLRNTLIYVVTITIGMLVVCFMMSYSLSRTNMKGRKLVVIYLLIPMYFGGGLIPGYLNMVQLGLNNTMFAIILPSLCSISHIILITTYLRSLPKELEEAAFVDGASHWSVMRKVCLPLAKPVLAVVSIYQIVGEWNSWFPAMVYLSNFKLHPIQIYLRRILVEQTNYIANLLERSDFTAEDMERAVMATMSSRQLRYAVIMVVTIPIVCVYPIFQRYFVKGVMMGSLKG